MKLLQALLMGLFVLPAIGQGVRFDAYNMTSASNVPFGAQAPIFTLPNSTVTVCAYPDDGGQPCGNVIPIYSDPALTQTADNPITADVHGRFGFWLAPGTYTYSVVTQGGLFAGTYIFTLGNGGNSDIVFQTNGVNNLSQILLDLDQGSNITLTNTSGGHVRIDAGGGLVSQVIPPTPGQYVVVYPTTVTGSTGGGGDISIVITPGKSGGAFRLGYGGGGCGGLNSCDGTITWSGFALPTYVDPANVTSIVPFAVYSSGGGFTNSQYTVSPSGSASVPAAVPAVLGQANGSTSMTGAQIATSSITWTTHTTLPISGPTQLNIPAVGYIVYYSGPAPPTNSNIIVVPPLYFNQASLNLGIDALALSYSVGLNVSQLPTAASFSGKVVPIINGANSTDCSVGGGSSHVWCYSNGTSWTAF